jgi:5-methylcytosine-specific restriction endonuclease McrA
MPCDVTDVQWAILRSKVLDNNCGVCAYCGANAECVDHVIPEARGGLSCASNLVAACLACNSSKGSRTAAEWAKDNLQDLRELRRRHAEVLDILLPSIAKVRK